MFTKEELKKFRVDFDKAMADLGKKYNVKIELGNIRYTENEFHTKLTASVIGAEPKAKDKKLEFEVFAGFYGFKKEDFGRQFTASSGEKFTISGINTRAKKSPIELTDTSGKIWKAGVDFVKFSLLKQENQNV